MHHHYLIYLINICITDHSKFKAFSRQMVHFQGQFKFKAFSRHPFKFKAFSRHPFKFKAFSRHPFKFKAFSSLCEPWQSYARRIRNLTLERSAILRKKDSQYTQERSTILCKKDSQSYARKLRSISQENIKDPQCFARKIRNVTQERFAVLRKKDL